MKTFGLQKFAVLLSAFALVLLPACNTESVDYDTPSISVDKSTVDIPTAGGSVEIAVTTNRPWNVEIPEDAIPWLVVSPMSGSGNATVTVTALPDETFDRETTIKIATSTIYEAIKVSQAGAISLTEIYAETFGTTASGNPWVADFNGWAMTGPGSYSVYYTGVTTSVRTSLNASASGGDVIFFGAVPSSFTVNTIAVPGVTTSTFSFGISKASGAAYTTVVPSEMVVSFQTDNNQTWTPMSYALSSGDGWVTATAGFTVPSGAKTLTIKFESSVASVYRIDDLKLVAEGNIVIPPAPRMTTGDATNVAETSATLAGSYTYTATDPTIAELGVAYRKNSDSDYTLKAAASPVVTPYTVAVTGLSEATDYVYAAYARMSDGNIYYGAEKTFKTKTTYVPPTPVTTFSDDFSTVTAANVAYTGNNWNFYSSDASDVAYGWKTGTFGSDKYIQIAPFNSTQTTVTSYAIMPPVNVQGAAVKKLFYNLTYYYPGSMTADDGTKFEVVVSNNYEGNASSATWTVVDNATRTFGVDAINEWKLRSVDLSASYGTATSLVVAFRYTGKGITYRLDDVTFGSNVGVTYGTPSLEGTGTLKQGTAITAGAKIVIPYKFGNGAAVNVTASSNIGGITIAPFNGSLQNGNGAEADIELAVSGTPTGSGDLTITISGLTGLSPNTITGTVASSGAAVDVVVTDVSLSGITIGASPAYTFSDGTIIERVAAAGDTAPNLTYTAGSSSLWTGEWNKAGAAWVITSIPVTAEITGNVKVEFAAFGVNASPRKWLVQYSNNNSTWVDTGATYDITATTAANFEVTINVAAANKVSTGGKLYIKLYPDPSSTVSVNGGAIGTSNVNSRIASFIKITKLAQ